MPAALVWQKKTGGDFSFAVVDSKDGIRCGEFRDRRGAVERELKDAMV
jgi:hypothetical protein